MYTFQPLISQSHKTLIVNILLKESPVNILYFFCVSAIGGPTGDLLEHNAQVLSQISSNITNMQVNI